MIDGPTVQGAVHQGRTSEGRALLGTAPFDETRTLRLRTLEPDADAAVVHRWVGDERARFWGMIGHTQEQVREIYAYVDSLDTHHAYLVEVADTPVALLQTYRPDADPVGEVYPVRPGDLGFHFLLGPTDHPESGFTLRLAVALIRVVLTDPDLRRVVAEPDAANGSALSRLERTGFVLGDEVDLPDKRARLAFLEREAVEGLLRAAGIE